MIGEAGCDCGVCNYCNGTGAMSDKAKELAEDLHHAAREERETGHVTTYSWATLDAIAAELTRLAEVERLARGVCEMYSLMPSRTGEAIQRLRAALGAKDKGE